MSPGATSHACVTAARLSIDLAELQADMAFEAYLAAFDEDAHPETLDSLETEALIARRRYDDLRNQGLGH